MTKTASIINLVLISIAIVLVFSIKYTYNEKVDAFDNKMNDSLNYDNYEQRNQNGQSLNGQYGRPFVPQNYNYVFQGLQYPPEGSPFSGQQYPNQSQLFSQQAQMSSQPLLFPNQLYPKNPYFPQASQSCIPNSVASCGSMGVCVNNVCQIKQNENGTVFNIPIA